MTRHSRNPKTRVGSPGLSLQLFWAVLAVAATTVCGSADDDEHPTYLRGYEKSDNDEMHEKFRRTPGHSIVV